MTGKKREVMNEVQIILPNNVTRRTCCLDSNTIVKVYHQERSVNETSNQILSHSLSSCQFSDIIAESCSEDSGLLDYSQICLQQDFVIKKYSKIVCSSGVAVRGICNSKFNCNK